MTKHHTLNVESAHFEIDGQPAYLIVCGENPPTVEAVEAVEFDLRAPTDFDVFTNLRLHHPEIGSYSIREDTSGDSSTSYVDHFKPRTMKRLAPVPLKVERAPGYSVLEVLKCLIHKDRYALLQTMHADALERHWEAMAAQVGWKTRLTYFMVYSDIFRFFLEGVIGWLSRSVRVKVGGGDSSE